MLGWWHWQFLVIQPCCLLNLTNRINYKHKQKLRSLGIFPLANAILHFISGGCATIFAKPITTIVGIAHDTFTLRIGININAIMPKRWDLFYLKVISERERKSESMLCLRDNSKSDGVSEASLLTCDISGSIFLLLIQWRN